MLPEEIDGLAAATDGFSFAFLQELETSATLAWAERPDLPFVEHLRATVAELRRSITIPEPPNPDHGDED